MEVVLGVRYAYVALLGFGSFSASHRSAALALDRRCFAAVCLGSFLAARTQRLQAFGFGSFLASHRSAALALDCRPLLRVPTPSPLSSAL